MYQDQYYIDKTTDTFADVLLAFGVTELLFQLQQEQHGTTELRIRDDGGHFTIKLAAQLQPGAENVAWFSMLPFIETKSKKRPAMWTGEVVDYEAERARNTTYFEQLKQLPPAARRPGASVDEFPMLAQLKPPRSDWSIIAQINQMGAISAYAQVVEGWLECKACFADVVRLVLGLFANTPNDEASATALWKQLAKQHKLATKECATPVQVLNPAMGKGINRAKADGADKIGNPEGFWLLEYLKFVGLFQAGAPRVVKVAKGGAGKGPRDRKTYVLHPCNIQYRIHKNVYKQFGATLWETTAIKMDVLAALRYTDVFLAQWIEGQADDPEWGEEPGNHVRGLATAFYKDLGSAVALLNLSEVALPRWMPVSTKEQGVAYRNLIEEHRQVITSLDEGKAEGGRLLTAYRNFVSGHDLRAFFEFTGGYSALLMSRMERGEWAPRLSTTQLEVLMTSHDQKLGAIIENSGFQRVATAIRLSTVNPQFFKAKGNQGPYDIRYGLGTDLLRQAAYPDRFIQALSEFVYAYNQENGQVLERYKAKPPVRRPGVTTEDLAEVVGLIDRYGSQTVANLLVAFGYARSPKDPDQPHDEKTEQNELTPDGE